MEKIWSLKIRYNGSLHYYIDRFQGLAIMWGEIKDTVQPDHRFVTQMVDQIEDPLVLWPCDSIKNWDNRKETFRNAAATLCTHEIRKNARQTNKVIKMEVKSLLLGNVSNKRRATGEPKAMRAFRLCVHDDVKNPK